MVSKNRYSRMRLLGNIESLQYFEITRMLYISYGGRSVQFESYLVKFGLLTR